MWNTENDKTHRIAVWGWKHAYSEVKKKKRDELSDRDEVEIVLVELRLTWKA